VIFEAKDGTPEWEKIYQALVPKKVGELVDYAELSDALGRDFLAARGPLTRAADELLRVNQRALENVRGAGYRVVQAREHETLARRQQRSARRRSRKAHELVQHVDRSGLTPEEISRFQRLEMGYAMHEQILKAHADRIDSLAARVDAITGRQSGPRSSDDLRREERLERLEDAVRRLGGEEAVA
jgi:hypothetical protein